MDALVDDITSLSSTVAVYSDGVHLTNLRLYASIKTYYLWSFQLDAFDAVPACIAAGINVKFGGCLSEVLSF